MVAERDFALGQFLRKAGVGAISLSFALVSFSPWIAGELAQSSSEEPLHPATEIAVVHEGIEQSNPPSFSQKSFTENVGQVRNPAVRYYLQSNDLQVGFTRNGLLFALTNPQGDLERVDTMARSRSVLVRLTYSESNGPDPAPGLPTPWVSNFLTGRDVRDWKTDVRNYFSIAYENLYDGIDLYFNINSAGLKYYLRVETGVDPSIIRLKYEGMDSIEIDRYGTLVIRTPVGEIRDSAPMASAGTDNVSCRFRLVSIGSVGFECSGWHGTEPLIIDPLVYSTYLGGSGVDEGKGIHIDSSGNAYVTGRTASANFPTTPGAYDVSLDGAADAYVTKIASNGRSLVYSTFLGGSSHDHGESVKVDSQGSAYVVGSTLSTDFPTSAGSYDTTYNGDGDVFVTKLNAQGNGIVYSTYLGGGFQDVGNSVALLAGANPEVILTGFTGSSDFPTTVGGYDTTPNGGIDAFVSRFDSNGATLIYSTYLGGTVGDQGHEIARDAGGAGYVVGFTSSSDFPTTSGALDTTFGGSNDGFVTKLALFDYGGLFYSTFLGGSFDEAAESVAVEPSTGAAFVTGNTASNDFPIGATFGCAIRQNIDAFVAKLNPQGSGLDYLAFLCGTDGEWGHSIVLGPSTTNAYVTGITNSNNFPTTQNAYDKTHNGMSDVFVTKVAAAGDQLVYSTYLGGSGNEEGLSIAMLVFDDAYVTGWTQSSNFPTTPKAFDRTFNGGDMDAFAFKLNTT